MKIKVHKMKGVDKSFCCAEQKIAYNYAFMYYDCGLKIINSDAAYIVKSDALFEIEKWVLDSLKRNGTDKKYNIDAIMIAFRQGFKNYCKCKYHIFTSHKQVAEIFKIPYDII